MLQIIGGVMEWIIGNTFPFVVFSSYGKCLHFDNQLELTNFIGAF